MIEQISKQSINRPQHATFLLIVFLIGLYFVINSLFESHVLWRLALIPYEIQNENFIGLFSSPFVHTSFVHLILDVCFIWQRFSLVEKRAGPLFLSFHVIVLGFLIEIVYCFIVILFTFAGEYSLYYRPIMGISSIIIAINVIEIHLSSQPISSLLGIIHIPTKYMPFAISITFHIILDNTSTLSHLCALSVGYIYWLLFGKSLRKRWGHKQNNISAAKKDEATPPFKLPGTVIATFDVKSPNEYKSENTESINS